MVTDRTVLVRLKAHVSDFQRGMRSARDSIHGLTDEIDTTNDRTAWLAQSILGLGPALIPIGAAAVPAVAALATQMGIAGIAAGTAVLAFQGVGDGLKALNEYQLDPSAQNFAKLQEAMDKLGPSGAQFVRFLDQVGPKFNQLSMTARDGLFPGMEEGITHLLTLLPQVNRIVDNVSQAMGDLAARSGEALAGPRFSAFFDYIENSARPILEDMGKTVGFLVEGLANLIVAFGPLTSKFSGGLREMAQSFAEWSRSLDGNDSFQSFLQYLEQSGPRALEFIGALVDALAAIAEAAAPVGEVLLPALSGLLNLMSSVARTPVGPVFLGIASAMSIYGRVAALTSVTTGGLIKTLGKTRLANEDVRKSFTSTRPTMRQFGLALGYAAHSNEVLTKSLNSGSVAASTSAKRAIAARSAVGGFARSVGPAAGAALLLGASMSGLSEKAGLTNTTMGLLIGSMAGPWGAAIGGAIGVSIDFIKTGDKMSKTLDQINGALRTGSWDVAAAGIASMKAQLADMNTQTGVFDSISDGAKQLMGIFKGDLKISDGFKSSKVALSDSARDAQNQARQQGELRSANAAREAAMGGVNRATSLANAGYKLTAAGAREAAASQRDLAAATNAANAALSRAGAIDQYNTALLDARDALKENGRTLASNTRAGLANRASLRAIAEGANSAAEKMTNFTRKTKLLQGARENFIKTAVSMGATRAQAVRLANEFGLIDRIHAKPKVTESGSKPSEKRVKDLRAEINRIRGKIAQMGEKGAAAARARIAALKAQIDALRDKSVTITTYHNDRYQTSGGSNVNGGQGGHRLAGGGTVTGAPRYPYGDKVVTALAPGEEVISNRFGQADRHRTLLKAINDGVDVRHLFPGYADGGTAGVRVAAPRVTVGGASVRVIIDGQEVRAIVDERIADHEDMDSMRGRAS